LDPVILVEGILQIDFQDLIKQFHFLPQSVNQQQVKEEDYLSLIQKYAPIIKPSGRRRSIKVVPPPPLSHPFTEVESHTVRKLINMYSKSLEKNKPIE